MTLSRRFLLVISSITLCAAIAVSMFIVHDINAFWRMQTQQKINESRISYTATLEQVVATATASARLIAENELVARYFALPEANRYQLLSPAVTRYLNGTLNAFPFYQEITLILHDGFEEARSARGVANTSDYSSSEIYRQAWDNPSQTLATFEYHEDFQQYSLNIYRAAALVDRQVSARKKTVRAVIKVSIGIDYLTQMATEQLANSTSFILIHNELGETVLQTENTAANNYKTWLMQRAKKIPMQLSQSEILSGWTLVVGIPATEAFSAVRHMVTRGFIALVFGFTALAVTMYLILNSTVIRPIGQLVDAFQTYKLTDAIPSFHERHDEIGALQKAFSAWGKHLQEQTSNLQERAYLDSLTGLPNRNALRELLDNSVTRNQQENKRLALMFIDLDGFKQVNDVLGHDAGDALLQKVAERLTGLLRISDTFAQISEKGKRIEQTVIRLGGDEFTVVLPDIKKIKDVEAIGNRLLEQFESPFRIQGKEVYVGASIGVSIYPDNALTPRDLVKYADTAMYAAKEAGKMRIMFFNSDMFDETKARLQLENILHNAFANHEFFAIYQAKADPVTRKVVGFAVLPRLHSEKIGDVDSSEFIPVAEKIGLGDAITLLLIEEACRQINALYEAHSRYFSMSINISQNQLNSEEIFSEILEIIKKYRVNPEFIEFELTESALIENEVFADMNIKNMKQFGFRIALDDFGIGYSSLGNLKRYQFDALKIDRLFFKNLEKDPVGMEILASIIHLARKLNMQLVAEGVENQQQLNFVLEHNIDLVQGNIFAKAVKPSDMTLVINGIESNVPRHDI